MIVLACALLFVAVGVAFFVKRRELAHMQALLAGGSVLPGCAVAEGIAFLLLAAAVIVAWRLGYLPG